MKTKFVSILAGLIFIGLAFPFTAKADGMVLPPFNHYAHEISQKAVIVHEDGIETMVLQVSFQGNAKDFAWIVPTPSKPEVEKSSDNLFSALEELTKLDYNISKKKPLALEESTINYKSSVSVVETKKVGIFKIEVLSANDADDLVKWLSDNKYQFPEDGAYILESYIDNGWYFTAIKVDAQLVEKDMVSLQLKTGHATPVKFVFESDKIVYPLKISSIGIDEIQKDEEILDQEVLDSSRKFYPPRDYFSNNVPITIYVFSNHKVQTPTFSLGYASWIKRSKIENLAQNSQGNPWIKIKSRKLFLTKLSAYKSPAEMTEDLFLTNAPNNDSRGVNYTVWWLALIVFFAALLVTIISPLGFLFIAGAIIYHFTEKPAWKGVAVAMEFFSMILSLLTAGGMLIWTYMKNISYAGGYGSAYITFAALGLGAALVLMFIWRILEARRNS